jgi:50S ribosomal subunit-associated GTPase HflX
LRKYLDANTPIIIAGNKCDMPMSAQTVDKSMAEEFARQNEYTHVSTSAKSGHNVEETFALIGQKIIEK